MISCLDAARIAGNNVTADRGALGEPAQIGIPVHVTRLPTARYFFICASPIGG
jgi:hypothetical protein